MTGKPTDDDPDGVRFGLPPNPQSLLGEEPAARAERIAAVHKLIADVFALAERHLDPWSARKAWASAVPPLKRGARRGTRDAERDAFLLALFDHAAAVSGLAVSAVPAYLAKLLHDKSRPSPAGWKPLGNEAATERMIRRLVERRREQQRTYRPTDRTLLG